MKAILLLFVGLTGCSGIYTPYDWARDVVDNSCHAAGATYGRKDPDCPAWTMFIGKTPVAVFWGYKDAEMNRKACLAARQAEANSECYPVMGF